ncbi:hypothetical protein QF021_001958 [Acidovorax delafieldii]|uniref:ParB/Srx family N-terminal domain-containing protein n=1 Tax=Acidovorax delafieldii TaxID=47920 RepID=UPI002858E74C|nr:ParB/Srx family N-terminal domain-containing protein [Acidovorax delafieldii]MDR6153869.1 hypothetical protein [Acidovorax delafieldii]
MPVINVNIDKLDLDLDNPRYEQQGSQREALEMMLTSEPKKIQALAQHIIDNGLNPTDLITVIPGAGDRFIVVEGNRRTAVLRALRKPALLDSLPQTSALSGMVKKVRSLAVQASEQDLVSIDVAHFDSREEANVWIALKHTGENGGAGIVPWDGLQTARFRKGDAATSLLEYGKQQGWFTEQDINGNRPFPISTLARLVGDPDIRAVLGLELRHGQLSATVPSTELAKGVKRVVGDLLGDYWTVTKLKSKKDREGYAAQLPASARPSLKTQVEPWPVGHDAHQSKPANAEGVAKAISKPTSRLRTTLIPPSFIASINSPRINDIYRDLKRINVHTHPNACAVLLRVLIELSVDELIESKAVPVETQAPKRSSPTLADKINASVQWMRDNRMLTKQAAEGVRKHGGNDSDVVNSPTASVTTLHAFMHNRYASPLPSELNAMWSNGIEAFMGSLLKAIK